MYQERKDTFTLRRVPRISNAIHVALESNFIIPFRTTSQKSSLHTSRSVSNEELRARDITAQPWQMLLKALVERSLRNQFSGNQPRIQFSKGGEGINTQTRSGLWQFTKSPETATHALTSATIRMPGTHQPSDQAKAQTCSQTSWRSLVTTNSETALFQLVWRKYSATAQSYVLLRLPNQQVNFLMQGHGIETVWHCEYNRLTGSPRRLRERFHTRSRPLSYRC